MSAWASDKSVWVRIKFIVATELLIFASVRKTLMFLVPDILGWDKEHVLYLKNKPFMTVLNPLCT